MCIVDHSLWIVFHVHIWCILLLAQLSIITLKQLCIVCFIFLSYINVSRDEYNHFITTLCGSNLADDSVASCICPPHPHTLCLLFIVVFVFVFVFLVFAFFANPSSHFCASSRSFRFFVHHTLRQLFGSVRRYHKKMNIEAG